jgi:hypothetical protein
MDIRGYGPIRAEAAHTARSKVDQALSALTPAKAP